MARPYVLRKGVSSLNDLIDGYSSTFAAANKVFYVDANHSNASDANAGDDPNKPMLTIAGGYGRLTADIGDVLIVKGGDKRYRENELVIEKDGISIIGYGWGTEWNRTDSQTGTYVVKVQAKCVRIANMQISVNGANKAVYWGDGGASYDDNSAMGILEDCLIRGSWYTSTGQEGTIGVTLDGSSFGPTIRNNMIWAWATGIDVSDGEMRTSYAVQILNNYISGATYGIYWGNGAYGYNSVIEGNTIWDWKYDTTMTYGIYLAVSVGGVLVANNNIACAAPVYDSGDLNYWVGNKVRLIEAGSELLGISEVTAT